MLRIRQTTEFKSLMSGDLGDQMHKFIKPYSLADLPIAKKYALPSVVYIVSVLIIALSVYIFINELRIRNSLIVDVTVQKNILFKLESNLSQVNEGLSQLLIFENHDYDAFLLAKAEDFQSSLVEFRQIAQRHNFINDESLSEEVEPVLELMREQLVQVIGLSFSNQLGDSSVSFQRKIMISSNQIREFSEGALYGKSELVASLLKENGRIKLFFSIIFLFEVIFTLVLIYGIHSIVARQLIFPINEIKIISDEVINRYVIEESKDQDQDQDQEDLYKKQLEKLSLIQSKDEVGQLAKQFLAMMRTVDSARETEAEKKSAIETLYTDLKRANGRILKTQYELSQRNLELQSMHKELTKSNQHLEQSAKLSSIGEMSAGIAHEINQPLGVIRLYTDSMLLLLQDNSTKVNIMLRKNLIQIERISKIITHLKMFSRDNNDEKETVAVDWLIDQSLILISPELKRHSIVLNISIRAEEQLILCNQIQLLQVFTNLLNNAKDAIVELTSLGESHQVHKVISISVFTRAERIVIEISDTGNGIPIDLKNKIFQPFFTTKPVGKGTGLGLSICYGIIEEHAGSIACISEEGRGSTFSINLPQVIAYA